MSGTIAGKMRNLIPQLILEAFNRGQRNGRFPAAALFVDMTGFTPLTEALFCHRRRGAEVLSETLADVFRPMVQQVYARDGFIAHFAGDAFTAVFPRLPDSDEAVRRAWQTAVFIQQYLSETDEGRIFSTPYGEFAIGVRAGLASGTVSWHIPGADGRYTWYFYGSAIRQCAQAQKGIAQGEIAATNAFRQALGDEVTAVSQHGVSFCRLTVPETAVPPASPKPILPVSRSDLRPFIPDTVLDLTLPADFRHACPVFISLQGEPQPTAVDRFAARVLTLTNQYGGAFSRIEFGDKGGFIALWFGAPVACEDNVTRAAQCLLALRREQTEGIVWRAGLAYGLVWAGFRGADARWEYTLFGSAVNTAAHMAMQAGWGKIWLDETSLRECRRAVRTRPLGLVRLKSGARSLYSLTADRSGLDLFYPSAIMAGRQAELARLQKATAPIFQGQFAGAAAICGEAGMGKSRLLHELQRRLPGTAVWLTAPADAVLRQSLHPFRALLQHEFGQTDGRSSARFEAALNNLLDNLADLPGVRASELQAELRRGRPFLAGLAGLPASDSLLGPMEPRLRFENRVMALLAYFQARALLAPLILCLEDVHWLDGDSRRLLPRLLRVLSDSPAAVLLTSRLREDGAALAGMAAKLPHTAVYLEALTVEEIAALGQQLAGAPLSPDTTRFLRQRSGGNPYFAEQIILDLRERGGLALRDGAYALARADAAELPRTLNTLLIARLDHLPPPVKRAALTAAALGMSFAWPILAHMLSGDEPLAEYSVTAQNRRVWQREADGRYRFSHVLLQEAAYRMQPHAHLREVHLRAAQAYEAVYAADLTPHYGEIAYHYETAFHLGLTAARQKARLALQKAGETAAARYETETAVDAFSRALALTDAADAAARFALLHAREKVYEWRGERKVQAADLTAMQTLAAQLSWRETAVTAMRQATFNSFSVAYDRALVQARQAACLAQAYGDDQLAAQARRRLGHILYRLRRYDEAGKQLRQAVDLAQAAGDPVLQAQCLNRLGMTLDEESHYEAARDKYRQALILQQETDDLPGETVTLNNLGWVDFVTGYTVDARRHYIRALEISRRIGHRVGESNGLNNVGMTSVLLGDLDTAEQYFHQACRLYQKTDNVRGEANVYTSLALLYLYREAYEEVEQYAALALVMGQTMAVRSIQAESWLYLGHIYLAWQAYEAAEAAYKRSYRLRKELNQTGLQVEPLAGLTRLALARDDLAASLAYVEEILALRAEGDPARVSELESADLACYQTLLRAGDERAKPLLQQVYATLQEKAAKIEDPALRHAFWQNIPARRKIRELAGNW